MKSATLRRFATSPVGMHSQLHDNETSKPLGVVLEPDASTLPVGSYVARVCAAGVLIDSGVGAPIALRDCTDAYARGDVLIGAQIAKVEDRRARRVIAGRAVAFDRFLATLDGESFALVVIDPSPEDDQC